MSPEHRVQKSRAEGNAGCPGRDKDGGRVYMFVSEAGLVVK